MSEKRAVNPYNFIPFGAGPKRKPLDTWFDGERLSGWFDVQLKVKSPLIIPDASHYTEETVSVRKKDRTDKEQHKHYKFFHLPNGEYAIPGSTLRGLLRSTYEAASDSCLPFLAKEPDHPISQRQPLYAAFKDRGLLSYDKRKNVWTLYKAKAYMIEAKRSDVVTGKYVTSSRKYSNGQPVSFTQQSDGTILLGIGDQRGWLQFNVPVDSSKPYHVAILQKRDAVYTDKTEEIFKSLRTSVYDTVKNVDRANKKRFVLPSSQRDLLYSLNKAEKDGGTVPCYYFIVERNGEKLAYLSGAAVGRVRQRRNWEQIMGGHAPCKKQDQLCPACALFGSVQDGGSAGRVSVSDARLISGDKPKGKTLPILSTPRTSSFEFYLRKPNPDATYWNFDYYGVKASYSYTKDGKTKTVSYTDYRDLAEATPRGRKMYWHGKPQTSDQKSGQNATMEAMESGVFTFRIRFDRITRAQLGDLLWCVTLGDNKEKSKYCHKLGHDKPVGYGSVKLWVDSKVHLRVIDPKNGFAVSDEPHDPAEFMNDAERDSALLPAQVEAIRTMSDFYITKDKEVAYLTGLDNRGKERIYSWFQINRVNADDVLTLPEPTDPDITLPTKRKKRQPAAAVPTKNGSSYAPRGSSEIPDK